MGMTVNYERVYKARKFIEAIQEKQSLVREANRALDKAEENYRDFIKIIVGSADFQITNILCIADGIPEHVFSPYSGPRGIGKRICIFCGCDDFDIQPMIEHLHILQHALGVGRERRGNAYRNYFVTGPGTVDYGPCEALVEAGLMQVFQPTKRADGYVCFVVTEAGKEVVARSAKTEKAK